MRTKKRMINIAMILLMLWITMMPNFSLNTVDHERDIDSIQVSIVSNNLTLKNLDNDILMNEKKYLLAKNEQNTGATTTIETKKRESFYVKDALANLNYSKWLKKEKLQDLLLEGEKCYWEILIKNREVALSEEKVTYLTAAYENVQKQIDLGQEVSATLTAKELELQKEQLTYNQLVSEQTKLRMSLNLLMMEELKTEFNFTIDKVPLIEFDTDIDTAISGAILQSGELVKMQEDIDLLKMEANLFSLYGESKADREDKSEQLFSEAELKELEYKQEKTNIELDIRTQYNIVLNNQDNVIIAELTLDNSKLELEAAQKRFDLGIIKKDVLDLANQKVVSNEINLENAKLTYYLSVMKYNNLLN